jgi:Cysteine-rich secretory protein family
MAIATCCRLLQDRGALARSRKSAAQRNPPHLHHSAMVGVQQPAFMCGVIPLIRAAAAICVMFLLAGCASETPVVQAPSMYADMAVTGARLDAVAAASMISLYRQNNGLGMVEVDPELMRLAEAQSQVMAEKNKLDHDVRAPLAKRLTTSGYPAVIAVENVSAGYHTLAEAFSGWRDSPPHRANMLKSGVTKIGIAASYAPNTKYKVFWTMILAAPEPKPS